MKKVLLTVASLSLVVVMGIMFAACSSDATGKYVVESATYNGQAVEGEELEFLKEGFKDFELTADGKVKDSHGEVGAWSQDGKKVTFTIEGQSMEASFSGNKLTVEDNGSVIILKKV